MKKYVLSCVSLILLTVLLSCAKGEKQSAYIEELKEDRYNMNVQFSNKETTVLSSENFKNFTGLEFFKIDSTYRVNARFVRTPNETPIMFATSTDRKQIMLKYGEAYFNMKGKELRLNVYQTEGIGDEYVNYLFIPFMDVTNGNESYGGGRYLDTGAPKNDFLVIDFNKAYNPYCAYNDKYSCVIPPKENRLPIAINAGIKNYETSGTKK